MRSTRKLGALAALAAALVIPTLLSACNVVLAGSACAVGDVSYAIGESFESADGCNTCTCEADGIACTQMACVTSCTYQGKQYLPGDSFPDSDGCNTCSCMEDGNVGCTAKGCAVICTWKGVEHQAGESFPAGDDCNTCTCMDDGSVECTEIACASCVYAGATYQPGDMFPALDGCNDCTCDTSGAVSCTKLACACDPSKEWWRDYVATDPAQCAVIDFACPENTVGFSNECGCGCEQSAACPEYFDCMPPSPCDIEKIEAECPYSVIAL